jgi:hypothetical protein
MGMLLRRHASFTELDRTSEEVTEQPKEEVKPTEAEPKKPAAKKNTDKKSS